MNPIKLLAKAYHCACADDERRLRAVYEDPDNVGYSMSPRTRDPLLAILSAAEWREMERRALSE